MNGDGSNDYVVGAPTVTRTGSVISPSTGTNSQAFLVFQNRSVTVPVTQSWLTATPEQRVGNINQLGNATQTNPFTNRGQPFNYNFDGITFFTSQSPNSQLGAFVAAAGPNAFVIGAPNYTGGGRLYYILASSGFNSITTKIVDLDSPANFPSLTILTIEDTTHPNAGLGSSRSPTCPTSSATAWTISPSVSRAHRSTARRAMAASSSSPCSTLPLNLGAEQRAPGASCFFVRLRGRQQRRRGRLLGGERRRCQRQTGTATTPINDILIGAPRFNNNAGAAYLVYGGSTLTAWVISSFPAALTSAG